MSDDEAAASASHLLNSSFIDQQLESEYEGVKIASVDEKLSVVKSPPNYDLILSELNKVQGTSAIQKTVLGLQQKALNLNKGVRGSGNMDVRGRSEQLNEGVTAIEAKGPLKDLNPDENIGDNVKLSHTFVTMMIDRFNKQNPDLQDIVMPVTRTILKTENSAANMQATQPVSVMKNVAPTGVSDSHILVNDERGNQVILSVPSNTQYLTLHTGATDDGSILLAPMHLIQNPGMSQTISRSGDLANSFITLQTDKDEGRKSPQERSENINEQSENDKRENKTEKDVNKPSNELKRNVHDLQEDVGNKSEIEVRKSSGAVPKIDGAPEMCSENNSDSDVQNKNVQKPWNDLVPQETIGKKSEEQVKKQSSDAVPKIVGEGGTCSEKKSHGDGDVANKNVQKPGNEANEGNEHKSDEEVKKQSSDPIPKIVGEDGKRFDSVTKNVGNASGTCSEKKSDGNDTDKIQESSPEIPIAEKSPKKTKTVKEEIAEDMEADGLKEGAGDKKIDAGILENSNADSGHEQEVNESATKTYSKREKSDTSEKSDSEEACLKKGTIICKWFNSDHYQCYQMRLNACKFLRKPFYLQKKVQLRNRCVRKVRKSRKKSKQNVSNINTGKFNWKDPSLTDEQLVAIGKKRAKSPRRATHFWH